MSLINQMLRDLDARQASERERAGLPPHLRTLPPVRTVKPNAWLLLLAGLAGGALIAWLMLGPLASPPPVTVPAAPAAQVAPAVPATAPPPSDTPPVVVASTPAEVPAAPAVVVPAPPPAPAKAVVPAQAPPSSASAVPVAKPPVPAPAPVKESAPPRPVAAPAPAPAAPVVATPKPPVASAPKAPAPAAVASQSALAGEAHIEKQPKGGQSRELAEAEYRKGMQAAAVGDSAAAVPALRRALENDPRHAKARQALLSVLAANRHWDEVKQVAQSGLALDPARSGWASILARLQHEQGDTEGAVKTLETHAAHAASDADFQGLFAILLHKRQRYAEAAQRYQAALAMRPGEGRWWYGLGLALEGAGRGDEAKAAFGKARDAGNLPADMLGLIEQKLR